ncbi:small multi-drug export protein [Saccharibacillus qingshengii]|uniref:small multi-drug export protein n=1 Tax=Saccharibacillus qingshengii TaxID=1763540 RepID=UPI001557A21E|nr:small multi-drug export protein [Saccharibacillus qingshengii]
MFEWIRELDLFWQYAALFLLAAAPSLDIFIVVPLGILWGLPPVAVSIIGFAGNFLMVILIGLFFARVSAWMERQRLKKGRTTSSKRETRARRIWEKYGVPGLALVAPAMVGTDIAAVLALSFGSSRRWVMGWMAVSLTVWTVIMAVGSVYGLSYAKQ